MISSYKSLYVLSAIFLLGSVHIKGGFVDPAAKSIIYASVGASASIAHSAHEELFGKTESLHFGKLATIGAAISITLSMLKNQRSYLPEMSAVAAIFYMAGKTDKTEEDKYKNIKRVGGVVGAATLTGWLQVGNIFADNALARLFFIGVWMGLGREGAGELAKWYHKKHPLSQPRK